MGAGATETGVRTCSHGDTFAWRQERFELQRQAAVGCAGSSVNRWAMQLPPECDAAHASARTGDGLDLAAQLQAVLLALDHVGPRHDEERLSRLQLLEECRLLLRTTANTEGSGSSEWVSSSSRRAAAAAAAAGAGGAGAAGLQACWLIVIGVDAKPEARHRAHRLLERLTAIAAACRAGLGHS